MRCVFCGKDDMEIIVLVPYRSPDGSLEAFACLECSKEKGLYCTKHDRPHIGFDDRTTACLFCIEELVEQEKHRAAGVAKAVFDAINGDEEEKEILYDAAEIASGLTGTGKDVAILRFVASRAKRSDLSIDAVVKEIIGSRTIGFIIGNSFKY